MALPGRGWYLTADTKETVEKTTKLSFDTQTLDDGDLQAISQEAVNLVSLEFDTVTFSGENPELTDLPVITNGSSLVTLVVKDSPTMNPGSIPAGWSAATELTTITLTGNSFTATEVDAILIALNTAVQAGLGANATSPVVNLSSNAVPTGASSAAVTALEGNSPAWTVTVDS